jgi:phosphoribosylformylglycinamidine synthase
MIHFFGNADSKIFAVQTTKELSAETISKLSWLFGNLPKLNVTQLDAVFIGPRAAMITPWSTNAVEITQNMGILDIIRIEEFKAVAKDFSDFDPMISEQTLKFLDFLRLIANIAAIKFLMALLLLMVKRNLLLYLS